MTGLEIAAFLIQNAPAGLQAAEDIFAWASAAWTKMRVSWTQDPATITPEQLLAQLERINTLQDRIDNKA